MTNEIIKDKIQARATLIQARNSLQEQIDLIESQLKAEMLDRAIDELALGGNTIRYKQIESMRFDSTRFKTDLGDQLYNKYCKPSICMRLTIS